MASLAAQAAAEDVTGDADRDKFNRADGGDVAADYDARMRTFERWLLDHGSKFPKLSISAYDTEVRGVIADQDIGPNETIIEIPLECLITVEMGQATDVGQAILHSDLELDAPKHVFLMLFILIDRKREGSHFKPYYDILPPTLSNMPIFWSQEELAMLEGSYLLTQVEDRNMAIENDYRSICELCSHFADVSTLEEFKWARMCVCSRNFGIIVNGVRTSAMVPYADMLNHYRPRETKWTYENHKRAFTITSLQSIRGGAQVYDSYGQKCNHRFLLNYGFAIENNREPDGFCPNEVVLQFDLSTEPADLYPLKAAFWARDGHSKQVRISVSDNENTTFMFSCLRVIVSDAAEFASLCGHALTTVKDVRTPLSMRNEVEALRLLVRLCEDNLARYPRTLAQDREVLAGDTLTPFSNERHAMIQVAGEKEVLETWMQHAEQSLELLGLDVLDDEEYMRQFRALAEASGFTQWMMKYCSLPVGVVGLCRKMERRRLQQASEHAADPTKPHIV